MKKDILVSVIIPIYNVYPYLRQCVDSVLAQTYSHLEILLVDDGSTDGSGQLAEELALEDARIRIFHKENGGLSSARNYGIKEAKGEYLCFLDSDDWVETEFVEKMLELCLMHQAQMAVCGYERKYPVHAENNKVSCLSFDSDRKTPDRNGEQVMGMEQEEGWNDGYLSKVQAMKCLDNIFSDNYEPMVISCSKLFQAELFQNLTYPSQIHEDEFLIHQLIDRSQRVAYTQKAYYNYRMREDSITGQTNRYGLNHLDILKAMENRIETCHKPCYKDFFPNIVLCYFEVLTQLLLRYREEDFRENHLKAFLRRKAAKVYFKYFGTLSNYYRKEYLRLLCNPYAYKCYVERKMK